MNCTLGVRQRNRGQRVAEKGVRVINSRLKDPAAVPAIPARRAERGGSAAVLDCHRKR